MLQLSTRQSWVNLSTYGFDARTSSYRVGGCSAYIADGTNGSGSLYTGNTAANAQQSAAMSAGWDNRIRSVYIA